MTGIGHIVDTTCHTSSSKSSCGKPFIYLKLFLQVQRSVLFVECSRCHTKNTNETTNKCVQYVMTEGDWQENIKFYNAITNIFHLYFKVAAVVILFPAKSWAVNIVLSK
jgi:hypothetical protein